MSRSRLDPAQRKISFSLAFSPPLIAALERVRGVKSQSVFVEEWLRQQPQIAAELTNMNDPGFVPPVARYEQLMGYLLEFYLPGDDKQSNIQATLFLAQKVILLNHAQAHQEIEAQIGETMATFWLREHHRHGNRIACGESLEAVVPSIANYARYYYQVIFQEMAQGERKQLQHHFRSLVRGCEAVYLERLKQKKEHNEGDGNSCEKGC